MLLGEHCALSGQLPPALDALLSPLSPTLLLPLLHCCCSCQLYSHVVVSLELQHGSFHLPICMQAMITASATLPRALSVPCSIPACSSRYLCGPRLVCACPALPDWRRSAVGVCSLCACFIIMPSSYAQRSHYLPHTLYTMYTIYIHIPLCIAPLLYVFLLFLQLSHTQLSYLWR